MATKKSVVRYDKDIPEVEGRDATQEPDRHLQRTESGEVEVVAGRRPSKMLLVNELRKSVSQWREGGYLGASETTSRLFSHWFGGAAGNGTFSPYWGQREAVETLVYLVEIVGSPDAEKLISSFAKDPSRNLIDKLTFETRTDGQRFVKIPQEGRAPEDIPLPPADLPRYAFKMATGSGKTLVMALVVVWSYFHAKREHGSTLTTNFLILAPNVIVFERLRTDFENLKVFRDLGLIPDGWKFDMKVLLRGDSMEPSGEGNLIVTNIQQLRETDEDWVAANPLQAILGKKPTGNAVTKARPLLERVRNLRSLMVLNDEAHHVWDDDLVWNQTLLSIHSGLAKGLTSWLDFSATPRFDNGSHFPWIVCDYPLAQAVEDQIVKAPMILHLVDKKDPDNITNKNVIEKYGDWIQAGVKRLQEHTKAFKHLPGTKPVMFIMCENVKHADAIGDWLVDKASGFKLKKEEVLVIHTDKNGNITKADLDALRKAAREVDDPSNPVKVVVSVLVLREGWDVRNVTVVLGLRPGTASSKILPEQAVGRGLRLMRQLGSDKRQVLEVMGTPSFENFVRELEGEGVYIKDSTKPPKLPVIVYPVKERSKYDIEIPQVGSTLSVNYASLSKFDPLALDPLFEFKPGTKSYDLKIQVEDALHGVEIQKFSISRPGVPLAHEILASITGLVEAAARLTDKFAELFPLVEKYVNHRCFGKKIDLESTEEIRQFLSDAMRRREVANYLGRKIGELLTEKKMIHMQPQGIKLSKTKEFAWRRDWSEMKKTVFNYVATFNPFETQFGEFLDRVSDIKRFAALAEYYTGFSVDYLKPSGALGKYFPDWVAVQKTAEGDVNWIIETKGRVWEGTEEKDAAIRHWCTQVSALTGNPWQYMRVDQPIFRPHDLKSFGDLVTFINERKSAISEQLLFEVSKT